MKLLSSSVLSCGTVLLCCYPASSGKMEGPLLAGIMLYKVVLTFECLDETHGVTIQMKATEQYFPVVLFIMLYKVVLTFESVDEIL